MIPTLIINGAITFVVGSVSTTVGTALYNGFYAISDYYFNRFKKKSEEE
jgi:hypothetical protein